MSITGSGPGCPLSEYAKAKRLPEDFLRRIGLTTMGNYMGAPAVRIPYTDEHGSEAAVQFRLALTGDQQFRWKKGSKLLLYGLWALARAHAAGHVTLVQSVSDCHTLWLHGIPAIGIPREGWQEKRDAHHLDGIPIIYLAQRLDPSGMGIETWLLASSIRSRVRLVSLGVHKDINEFYLSAPGHFRDYWQAAITTAVPWQEPTVVEAGSRRDEFWAQCEQLARSPQILDRLSMR